MTSILVVVTFLAGAAWGPVVTMTPVASVGACAALRDAVAQQIASAAKTNVVGGAGVSRDGDDVAVTAGGQGAREMARLSCRAGGG